MTARKCLFITGAAGTPTYSGVDDRTVTAALLGGKSFANASPGIGAVGPGHGILTANSLKVTANVTPNNTVTVAAGIAGVRGTQVNEQGVYLCPLDAATALTISAKHGSLTRVDFIVAQVRDDEYAAFVGDIWAPEVVTGTPGSGDPTVPEDCLVLARVSVTGGGGATVITNSNITDLRPHTRATGGITPVATTAAFPSPQTYDAVWDISTSALKMYNGSTWFTIATNLDAAWLSYTPTFGGLVVGNSTRYGRYQKQGRIVVFEAGFVIGSTGNVTNTITVTLPGGNATNPGGGVLYLGGARSFNGASGRFASVGAIDPASDATRLINFATAGTNPWNGTIPVNWDAGDTFSCFCTYEAVS